MSDSTGDRCGWHPLPLYRRKSRLPRPNAASHQSAGDTADRLSSTPVRCDKSGSRERRRIAAELAAANVGKRQQTRDTTPHPSLAALRLANVKQAAAE